MTRDPATRLAVARAFRELRERAGYSQEGLALLANLDRTYISGLERGRHDPTIRTLLWIAPFLSVTAAELVALIEKYYRARRSKRTPS